MSEPRSFAPPAPPRRDRRRYGRWLALIAALVIGIVIGGIIVAIFGSGDHITVRQANVPPAQSTVGTGSPPNGATLQLNAACLRALNQAQNGYNALGGFAAAVRAFDAGALDNIVRRVQQAQRGLSQDLRSCHAIAVLPNGSTTPVPLPSPSPTPSR